MLNRYVASCREEGLSNATINRDLAALRRAFNLALRAGKLQKVPCFPHLKESAPRSGFVEEADYRKLAKHARELWLRALLATAYSFGFRKSELLELRVRQVDLLNRSIRLNAGETKSGDGRVVKLTQDVFILLQACIGSKGADDCVFTRADGKPVLDFRERWEKLTTAAGCPALLFHDLRRSAVRNMVRRGVPETVAMKISGHKMRAVFDRYNVTSEADLADAAMKIEAGKQVWAEVGQNSDKMHHIEAAISLPLNTSTESN
jgi:integrase